MNSSWMDAFVEVADKISISANVVQGMNDLISNSTGPNKDKIAVIAAAVNLLAIVTEKTPMLGGLTASLAIGMQLANSVKEASNNELSIDDIAGLAGAVAGRLALAPYPPARILGIYFTALSLAPTVGSWIGKVLADANIPYDPNEVTAELLPLEVEALVGLAHGDASVRAALLGLSPIKVDVNPEVANALAIYDPLLSTGFITEQWIVDRTKMLSWMLHAYESGVRQAGAQEVSGDFTGGVSWQYEDVASGEKIRTLPLGYSGLGSGLPRHYVIFGDEGANQIEGATKSDRLYGGGGADVIIGDQGNDYLEGGKGVDTYVWNQGDGTDKIYEINEQDNTVGGRLKINGQLISKVVLQSSGVYEAAGCVFLRVPAPDGGELLVVRDKEGEGGVKVFGYNHTSNNFGIEWVDKPDGPSDSGAGKAASASIPPRRDPLALDLDGDGIETTGVSGDTVVLFDHDGDGIRTGTGWVKPDDGWLAMDRNGNGTIDNGSELFGVDTLLQNGSHATDGFAALAEWDSNHDGAITSADTVFSQLRIWRDLNQDGISQTGELQTLTDLNIVGIGVSATAGSLNLGNGNIQTGAGVFTRSDGSSGSTVEMESLAANLDLLSNTFYSQYPDTISLTTSAAALPNVGGSGRVRSLREAASLSSALDAVATDYAQQTTRSAQMSRLDDLMTSWAATSDLGSLQQQFARVNAQGNPATLTYSLAGYTAGTPQYTEMLRRIAVVESFMGFNYLGSGVSSAVLILPTPAGHPVKRISYATEVSHDQTSYQEEACPQAVYA